MESGFYGFVEPRRTRVLIVDDQVSVREMVAMVMDRDGGFTVVAEAGTGLEGLRRFRSHSPELVITGLVLPEMNGSEMIRTMRDENPAVRILIFTGSRNRPLLMQGLEAGPHGFVHKLEPLSTFRRAFHAITEGHGFFGPFATKLLDDERGKTGVKSDLTPRQRVVLQMIAEGASTKQVAAKLSLSPKTVEHYRTRLMQRLGLRDVASLTRYAMRCGLISAE
jgi:DNA-binding NarL/FixJ family response regulator